ncbi:MAG: glycosyltransferase [Nonlabens sp.]
MIFLSKYAKSYISHELELDEDKTIIIPHGIDRSFLKPPNTQKKTSFYKTNREFRILYISNITTYKHQWNVIKAIGICRDLGYPFSISIVGGISDSYEKVERAINEYSQHKDYITLHGKVTHDSIKGYLHSSDLFIFASSCENQPITLIEAVTAGLPVACSYYGPMPEIMEEDAFYFDPEKVESIKNSLIKAFENKDLRHKNAVNAFNRYNSYRWADCTDATMDFLKTVSFRYYS